MDWKHSKKLKLLPLALLLLASAIDGILADSMVTGFVFCDQCKDGQRSLFDYPLSGMKVTVSCANSDGQIMVSKEETTNWVGSYSVSFEGTPDLSGCYAQVSGSGDGSDECRAVSGPAQKPRLVFSMFDLAIYSVDSLLSQPAQPMSSCPRSQTVPAPVTPARPPPVFKLPPMHPLPPVRRLPPMPGLPPLPRLPPLPPMPPAPFLEASACSHDRWLLPEYRCYWRGVNLDTKVAVLFGMLAGRRYGTDMTLWQGLVGRGDLYRTLLREGITALLNSYNSLQFPYRPLDVMQHMNLALMGSQRSVLLTALRFMRVNSGYGKVTCKFTPCK